MQLFKQSEDTPLVFPGGKRNIRMVIRDMIPKNVFKVVSPFLGGGSVEVATAAQGKRVIAADIFEDLLNFWWVAKKSAPKMARRCFDFYPIYKDEYYQLLADYDSLTSDFERAVYFFLINRWGYGGLTFTRPGYGFANSKQGRQNSRERFVYGIRKLKPFRIDNLDILRADYRETIASYPDDFLYLDPPYPYPKNVPSCDPAKFGLYGRDGDCHPPDFDQVGLARILKNRDGWIMSNRDLPSIWDIYGGWTQIFRPRYQLSLKRPKDRFHGELLICKF